MTFTEFTVFISYLYDFSSYCAVHPVGWVGCNKFWGYAYLFAILFLFFFCYSIIRYEYKRHIEWQAYLKRKASREAVADEEIMSKYKWNGEF